MKTERKTGTDYYYMAGQKNQIPTFLWNVYGSYQIIELEEYFGEHEECAKDFYANERVQEYICMLESTKVIVPKDTGEYRTYNPLEVSPNLAASLAQLNKLNDEDLIGQKYLSDDAIIRWISKFGLLSNRPLACWQGDYLRHFSQEDLPIPSRFETLGRLLYLEELLMFYAPHSSSHYGMLRDTFIQLQEFTSDIFHACIAFKENRLEQSFSILGSMMPNHLIERLLDKGALEYERQINKRNKDKHNREQDKKKLNKNEKLNEKEKLKEMLEEQMKAKLDIANEILTLLSNIISINISGVRLNLTFKKIQNTYIAEQNWAVRDLWSAIMLQLYDYIACDQPFKKCLACNNYFSMKDQRRDRIYCPAGTGTYSDCKDFANNQRRRKS